MEFEFRSTLPATVDTVWAALENIETVALCIPGVVRVAREEEDRYAGALRIKVGPIALELGGLVTVELLDAATRTLRFLGEAKDRRVPGQIKSRATLIVTEHADGSELYLHSDTHILGKLGEFGQPVVRKKTEQVLREFTENLGRQLTGDDTAA
ncbi:MAG: SRPBCC family protein [Immundisolibacter sp.]|uniref:SRPBCC family protein n=1 Tax=Immundisolibacter sp. TaxID=1934948 RepID=UPI003D126E2B